MRRPWLGLVALLAFGLAVGPSCAHRGGGEAKESAPKASKEEKAVGVPPPANSPLAKITVGMSEEQVRHAIGDPTNVQGYITGKQFIPYYYGSDTSRVDYKYKGQGRVVFSRNRYSGTLKVVRVDYDPKETGN